MGNIIASHNTKVVNALFQCNSLSVAIIYARLDSQPVIQYLNKINKDYTRNKLMNLLNSETNLTLTQIKSYDPYIWNLIKNRIFIPYQLLYVSMSGNKDLFWEFMTKLNENCTNLVFLNKQKLLIQYFERVWILSFLRWLSITSAQDIAKELKKHESLLNHKTNYIHQTFLHPDKMTKWFLESPLSEIIIFLKSYPLSVKVKLGLFR
jgi:hypothetical protein